MLFHHLVQLEYETNNYQATHVPNHNGFGMPLSFLDIVELRLLYIQGPTQGRILDDANDTGSCKGFSALYHSGGSPLYQRRMTQF